MKHKILKALAFVVINFGLLSTVSAEGQAKEWGGFYGKFSFGYGKPEVVKKNVNFNEDNINGFLKAFSATAREIAYDYRIGNNFAIGAEAGITFFSYPHDEKSDALLVKGEFVPQLSYLNNSTKIFVGLGLGFANGYGLKGLPNAFAAIAEKGFHTGYDELGGYWLAEVGVDYLLTEIIFIGAKYQYERTLNTFQNVDKDQSLYVQQHTFLATVGIKY